MSIVVVLVVAGFWAICFRNPVVWRATGIGQTYPPFLDLYGLLAAGEVAHANGNPYQPIALDPLNRPHLYAAWWLASGSIGLTAADSRWLGQVLAGLTLVGSVLLIRPRRIGEAVQTVLVLCSPAVLMALNRANNDLVILIIICAALGCLRAEKPLPRILGVMLLAVAAVLKYYPLVTMVVLLSARTRRDWGIAVGVFALVVALGWPAMKPGLESVARYKPHPDGLYAFGAPTLFRDFGIRSPAPWLALTALIGMWGAWLVRGCWKTELDRSADQPADYEFICGAAMIVGGFFLGASYAYKLIFAVWFLPWIWSAKPSQVGARWRRATWWLLLAVLWLEGIMAVAINLLVAPLSPGGALRVLDATFVVSQALTWGLMACLLRHLVFYGVRRTRCLVASGSRPAAPA